MTALDLVSRLVLGDGARPVDGVEALRAHVASLGAAEPIVSAALGGRASSGLGWAFACGYQAALARLASAQGPQALARALPRASGAGDDGDGALVALCASEEGGAHPRAIRATLTPCAPHLGGGWRLSGEKTFVTLGEHADRLVVVATTGDDAQGRPRLRAAWVPARREGVALSSSAGAPLPFAPEIAHARLALRDVVVADDELSPGDGYADVLKPFRTIEDAHVLGAALGYGIAVARETRWDPAWIERAVAGVLALRVIAGAPPSRPETHVALAGALSSARALLDAGDWARAPEATRDRWMRDRLLLDVAQRARDARTAAAWRSLG